MHIQLRHSGFILRNIKILGICTTFHWKQSGADSRPTILGTDVSIIIISMFCRFVRPKASSIRSEWTYPAF